MTPPASAVDLHSEYPLADSDIEEFRQKGFVHLEGVLSPDAISSYSDDITSVVEENNHLALVPFDDRDTYDKAFIQITNLWRLSSRVETFVFSKRLAKVATELLGVSGVRMYHDQALYKEAGGGLTPWHADQYYWPLVSNLTCTAWIPLQDTSIEMGPLAFSAGSHSVTTGRELEISHKSEITLKEALSQLEEEERPFKLGDVSFHYGWTFHHTGPNSTDIPRNVMTIIYMDEQMRLKAPDNPNQQNDWDTWCPGAKVGELIDTPINPVMFRR